MICSKCGMKVNEGDKVCTNCKTPLQVAAYEFDTDMFNTNNQNTSEDDATDDVKISEERTGQKKRRINKVAIVTVIIGIVLVCSALLVIIKINSEKRRREYIASRTFTLDKDDFSFVFTSYYGYGTPNAYPDMYEVFNALMPALGFKEESIKTKPVMQEIYENITVTYSENSKLRMVR